MLGPNVRHERRAKGREAALEHPLDGGVRRRVHSAGAGVFGQGQLALLSTCKDGPGVLEADRRGGMFVRDSKDVTAFAKYPRDSVLH